MVSRDIGMHLLDSGVRLLDSGVRLLARGVSLSCLESGTEKKQGSNDIFKLKKQKK